MTSPLQTILVRPCEIEIPDGAALPVDVHRQRPAGHMNLHLTAADLSLKGERRYYAAGAGAAGVGEILHAPLEGALVKFILTGQLIEVDVGALGEASA